MLSRRQLLQRGGALAAGLALPVAPGFGAGNLRKLIDIGPGGVISPGAPQDYPVGQACADGLRVLLLPYAEPYSDCGLLEAAPSKVKRPAYAVWKTSPRRV